MRKLIILTWLITGGAAANEGMWQPHQLPDLAVRLKAEGLEIDPGSLAGLARLSMNVSVSLGDCSASFVSPSGLIITNHHCVYDSVLFNSSPDSNLLDAGFLARETAQELPASPGSRVFVTEEARDVTDKVLDKVSASATGLQRHRIIENNIKKLIADCELTGIHRCSVPALHYGLQYFLIRQLEIRDVRMVYAPAAGIGRYGGDIDNWQWPRHTGDFGFYRAYVGKDGKPADFSPENVPYRPGSYLKVSANGSAEGDLVMALGYPYSTNRYRTADEMENEFTWYYPTSRRIHQDIMAIIHANSKPGSRARIGYESTYAGLSNHAKYFRSMIENYTRSDLLERKKQSEKNLRHRNGQDGAHAEKFARSAIELGTLIDLEQATQERDLLLHYLRHALLPAAAIELHRLASERYKPDEEREPGYQQRDIALIEQSLKSITIAFDEKVERAILLYWLEQYARLPETQRIKSIDNFFSIEKEPDREKLAKFIERIYRATDLGREQSRLRWMHKPAEEFEKSTDPLIRFAVSIQGDLVAIEQRRKELAGNLQLWRPRYMETLIAFNRGIGRPIYADANGTLRVSLGRVKGNVPRDGLRNLPFTALEGIVEKATGVEPFDAPKRQLELIKNKHYGKYKMNAINSVPVNFLSTLDIAGGNSGSPVLNGNAELVGLVFDNLYEGIIGDWNFDERKNRAIAVDIRYVLWVMEYLDNAGNLLKEMEIAY